MENKVKLGYWGIRGRGQVPRLLLAYTGAVWEDVQYTAPPQWFGADKEKLGFDFPNLPYLIEGDIKLTETQAICQYIIMRAGEKHRALLGASVTDAGRLAMVGGFTGGILEVVAEVLYSDKFEKKDEIFKEKIAPKLDQLGKFVGDKDFVLGYLTLVDFWVTELSHYIKHTFEAEYKNYGFLERIRAKFEGLPEIKAYYDQKADKVPFNSPQAKLQF